MINKALYNTFDTIINFAYIGKKYTPNWEGKKEWDHIKNEIIDNMEEEIKWNPRLHNCKIATFRNKVFKNIKEFEHYAIIEHNHFLIQCMRIPIKYEFSYVRLFQIAYNIGQLKASQEKIDINYMNQFYQLKLDKIETYIIQS